LTAVVDERAPIGLAQSPAPVEAPHQIP